MIPKHLLIFDVDGTLVHSLESEAICFPRACEMALGLTDVSSDWDSYIHPSDSGIVSGLIQRHFERAATADDLVRVEHCFLSLLQETYAQNSELCRPVPGAIAAFEYARNLSDTCVSIATAGWSATATFKLSTAGFEITNIPMASSHDAVAKVDIISASVKRARLHAGVSHFTSVVCIGDAAGDARAAAALGYEFIGIDTSGYVRGVQHRFLDFTDLGTFAGTVRSLQETANFNKDAHAGGA